VDPSTPTQSADFWPHQVPASAQSQPQPCNSWQVMHKIGVPCMHPTMHPKDNKNIPLTLKGNGTYFTQSRPKRLPYPGQQCPDSFPACSSSCMLTCKWPRLCYLQAMYQQITAPARFQVFNHHSNFTDIMFVFLTKPWLIFPVNIKSLT